MENDKGTEISHLYMTAIMVKIQLALSVHSSLSPVISFSIHHLPPHFPLLPLLPVPPFPFSVIFLIKSHNCLPPLVSNPTLSIICQHWIAVILFINVEIYRCYVFFWFVFLHTEHDLLLSLPKCHTLIHWWLERLWWPQISLQAVLRVVTREIKSYFYCRSYPENI